MHNHNEGTSEKLVQHGLSTGFWDCKFYQSVFKGKQIKK